MRQCEIDGCLNNSSYKFKGEKARRCAKHKEDNMRKASICCYPGCLTEGSYHLEGSKERYCALHKEDIMITNAGNKICEHPDCNKCAVFGDPGSKTKIYCRKHKNLDMINIDYERMKSRIIKKYEASKN